MRTRGLARLLATVTAVMAGAVAAGPAGAQSSISGRVELSKRPTAPVANQRYEIVSRGGVIALSPPLAVVYLEGAFGGATNGAVSSMKQKDMMFQPALLPVQAGTKVEFPNLDATYHNVFSYSPAKRFDLGRYLPEERPIPSQVFDVPGLVTIRCDIHEHMRGLILALPTPHFGTTEPDGRFELKGLPAGRYMLKAWLSSKTTLQAPVELGTNTLLHLDFP